MPPRLRLEQQVLARCTTFWNGHGTDAHTPAGMQHRAAIWALTGRKPTLAAFEEALEAINTQDRIKSDQIGLWDGEREVRPGEPDYAACKAQDLETQEGIILEKVRELIP